MYNKHDSTVCGTLLLCYVTIFCCFRFNYSVRAVKDGEKKEGKFIKLYIYIYIYIYVLICLRMYNECDSFYSHGMYLNGMYGNKFE